MLRCNVDCECLLDAISTDGGPGVRRRAATSWHPPPHMQGEKANIISNISPARGPAHGPPASEKQPMFSDSAPPVRDNRRGAQVSAYGWGLQRIRRTTSPRLAARANGTAEAEVWYTFNVSDHIPVLDALSRHCVKCGVEKPSTEDFFHARSPGAGGGLNVVCRVCVLTAGHGEGSLAAKHLRHKAKPGTPAAALNEDILAARAGAIVPATATAGSRMAITNALRNANNVVEANARLFTERMFVWAMDDKHPLQRWAAEKLADRILPTGVVPAVAAAEVHLPTDPDLTPASETGQATSAKGGVFISIGAANPVPAAARVIDVKPIQERDE